MRTGHYSLRRWEDAHNQTMLLWRPIGDNLRVSCDPRGYRRCVDGGWVEREAHTEPIARRDRIDRHRPQMKASVSP